MKNITKHLLFVFIVASLLIACDDKNKETHDNFDVLFELPTSIDVVKGGEFVLTVKDGKLPQTTDLVYLESDAGISYVCPIIKSTPESFTVQLANECATGYYKVYIKRDDRKKPFGKTQINIVKEIAFVPDEGTTIYGLVATEEGGVANVVVSDGEEVTVTDKDGIYQLKSTKKWGYVFISVPSGHEVPADGVLPQFHRMLKAAPDAVERMDFTLTKVKNQDSYKVFMLGDMHLANRTSDSKQFVEFTADLNNYMASHRSEKMYAIALGDMTWDLYWYSNNYYFPQYLRDINAQIKGLQIFHVMGNHDNDFKTTSDYAAAVKYIDNIAPTYYSFNIGKVHYVVMDDIDCSNYDGTDSRNYVKKLSNEQLDWLVKDLSYVSKETPLVIAMHAQIFYPVGSSFKIDHDPAGTKELFDILDGYSVNFVTGHTHKIYNVTPESSIIGVEDGHNFYEHNSGAICASWWWSGHLTPGVHLGTDGSPGGYGIWDVSDTNFSRIYKSTGWTEDYQFRSYDLNNVEFSMADVPNMPANVSSTVKRAYQSYVSAYPANNNNEVLIKIWNWNPNWTLSVVDENNNTLTPKAIWAYDPLHIAALSVKRFNQANLTSTPAFITELSTNFFKVKASDAEVDLKITVTDEFGNKWIENMERPKAFSTDAYLNK